MNNVTWHQYWIDIAKAVSSKSPDEKYKVGCIFVTPSNNRLIGSGFNGGPMGGTNHRLSQETGNSGFIHAELNAIINSTEPKETPKICYVTLSPCYNCAIALINYGVKEVYYKELYKHDQTGIKLLNSLDIKVEQLCN